MAKRKRGRPTKYRAEMCERVVACGREGMSRAEIALELDICFNTLGNWEEEHPEFLRATTRAKELAQGWWERIGRMGCLAPTKEFNAQAYSLQMRNRFPADWREKTDHELSGRVDGGVLMVPGDEVDPELWSHVAQRQQGAASVNGNGKRNGKS